MDILTLKECFGHCIIVCDVGQHPQLDLGVVCIDQYMFGILCNKHFPHFAAAFGADGDILQIGFG